MTDLFNTFGLKPFNVGIVAWLFFFLFTVIGASGFFALFFVKSYRDYRIRKRIANKKIVDQKWLRRFNILYASFFVLIALLGVTLICVLMARSSMRLLSPARKWLDQSTCSAF